MTGSGITARDGFSGTTGHRRELGGLTVIDASYDAGSASPRHAHESAFLCFMVAGGCTQSVEHDTWIAKPSSLTILSVGVPHANRWHDSGGRVLLVEFSQPWLQRVRARTSVLETSRTYDSGPPVWIARRLAEECHREDCSSLALEGLVLELLAECSRAPGDRRLGHAPAWLSRARDLLHDSVLENLSTSDVADSVGVSADHLARTFRGHYGVTMGEYVRRVRVDLACQRLAASDVALVEVALEAGFSDQSHFTKVFKRYTSMAPSAFRRINRGRRFDTKRSTFMDKIP